MPEITTLTLVDRQRRPILSAIALGDPDVTIRQLIGTAKQYSLPAAADVVVTEEIACRGCGCTEDHACITADGPCCWIEEDLCSACAATMVLLP